MNIIETQNLTKTYGDFTAVSNLNLHIRKGSVYGFLGPNGAGTVSYTHLDVYKRQVCSSSYIFKFFSVSYWFHIGMVFYRCCSNNHQ